MGVVGGIVGVIGGLGGFTLPIMFGIAADVIGVRSSCFMLMTLVIVVTMIWMWVAERNEREGILEGHAATRDALAGAGLIERTRPRRHVLVDWRPDDEGFWATTGRRIATRNLLVSMPALLLAFAVWVVWSVIVVELPHIGFKFTTNQLFWLAALPGISGAVFRALYSFVVPIFGGRNWTVWSTTMLLLPTLWIGFAVQDPSTNYAVFAAIALLCGLGAGNFSSSMAHISFLYPKRLQGTALGANAGVGNLGVGLAQLIAPLAMYGGALLIMGGSAQTREVAGATVSVWVQNAGFIWVPLIVLAVLAAWFGMDNIASVRAGFAEQVAIIRNKQQWRMSWLYLGHLRLVHRTGGGLPDAAQYGIPGGLMRFWHRVRRTVARGAGAPDRRLARRPRGRGDDHGVGVRRDGDRAARRGALPARRERWGQPHGVRARVHRNVYRGRRRQRLNFPHDPDHLSHAARARGQGRERHGGAGGGAPPRRDRGGGDAGLQLGRRGARPCLHPDRVWHIHQADGQPAGGAGILQRLLPELRAGNVALVCAPRRRGGLLTTAGSRHLRRSARAGLPAQARLGVRTRVTCVFSALICYDRSSAPVRRRSHSCRAMRLAMPANHSAVDPGGNDPCLEHGVHRRNGGQRRASGAAAGA